MHDVGDRHAPYVLSIDLLVVLPLQTNLLVRHSCTFIVTKVGSRDGDDSPSSR
jgi:hypothetical protein